MNELEQAKEFFAADRYATEATGIEIVAVGEKYAKCKLQLQGRHENAMGHLMGGVPYTLADFVFAVATNHGTDIRTVTVSSTINYLSPARGDTLYAETRLLKDGKRTCFYEITITDNRDTTIAVVTTTGMHLI